MGRFELQNRPALYAITDEKLTPPSTIIAQVSLALKHGVTIVQYRDKSSKNSEIVFTCKELQTLCREYGAMFVVNDRVELACQINADALHVGKDDLALKKARDMFDGVLGVSCYGDIGLAKKALDAKVDYVAFGSFFPSLIKPNSARVDLNVLQNAQNLQTKIAVIGGINQENISCFKPYKVDMICAISSIFSGDIEQNVKALKAKIDTF